MLAVQMPAMHDAPLRRLYAGGGAEGPSQAERLGGPRVGADRFLIRPATGNLLRPLVDRPRHLGNDLPASAHRRGCGGGMGRRIEPAAIPGAARTGAAGRIPPMPTPKALRFRTTRAAGKWHDAAAVPAVVA